MPTQNHPFNISEHPELMGMVTQCYNLAYDLKESAKRFRNILRSLPDCNCDYDCDCDCKYLEEEWIYRIQDTSEFVSELEFKIGNKEPAPVETKDNDPVDWLLSAFAFGFFLGFIVAYAENY
ncbi:uncharacterized protein PG998_014531 [Apiospora kogelbergensis]|uniref:uncharacterized protein n=1 Tax=Apiospora kogelbergensis TaxID=1337665 RepID=UPI00312D397F